MKISVRDLRFSYGEGDVLRGVSLDYDSSEFLSIIGPNGGGKSTLLRLILGLLKPSSGEIACEREFIGYVPQIVPLNRAFPVSVLEVALMGRVGARVFGFYSKSDRQKAIEALESVSMAEFATRNIAQLSGGQRQRVYIARALCSQAKILLLDEPTSSIDPRGGFEIYSLLKRINAAGTGIVMVSHDVNLALHFADRVAYVNRELVLHEIKGARDDFIAHLAQDHAHFCDVELALGKCGCQKA